MACARVNSPHGRVLSTAILWYETASWTTTRFNRVEALTILHTLCDTGQLPCATLYTPNSSLPDHQDGLTTSHSFQRGLKRIHRLALSCLATSLKTLYHNHTSLRPYSTHLPQ